MPEKKSMSRMVCCSGRAIRLCRSRTIIRLSGRCGAATGFRLRRGLAFSMVIWELSGRSMSRQSGLP